MPKFLIEGSYTAQGLKALMKDGGTGRRAAVETAVKSIGGKLESIHFAFGKHDVILVIDAPDNIAATALALAVNASGIATTRTTPLITPEEVNQAVKKRVRYGAPGKQ